MLNCMDNNNPNKSLKIHNKAKKLQRVVFLIKPKKRNNNSLKRLSHLTQKYKSLEKRDKKFKAK